MKKILFFLFLSITGITKAQTKLDIEFSDVNPLTVTRSASDVTLINFNIRINSQNFPAGTKLKIKIVSSESDFTEKEYSWAQPSVIELSSLEGTEWNPTLRINADASKKKPQGVITCKIEIENSYGKKVEFEDPAKIKKTIIVNPVAPGSSTSATNSVWEEDTTNTIKTEFVQYTDFLGFGNDRPNGLLQQQFLFKWPLIKKQYSLSKNFKIQFLRSILLPNILFNRIDKASDKNSLLSPISYTISQIDSSGAIKDTSLSPVLSSFDLLRYNSLKLEARIILLAVTINNTRIHLQIQGGLMRNKVQDTVTSKESIEKPIYSFTSGMSIYAKSLLDVKKQINIIIEAGYNRIKLNDNFFKQYDVYKLDLNEKKSIAFPTAESYNRNSKAIYYGSITLTKDWGKESKNSLFFRALYNYQSGTYRFYRKDRPDIVTEERYYNHFLQFHLGVSLGFEKLFTNG